MGTYRSSLFGRRFLLMMFVGGFLAVGMIVVLTFVGDLPVAFTLFLLGALGWNAYWWLLRVVYRMRLDAGELEWATPVRSGRLPLTEVTSIRPIPWVPGVVAIKRRTGRALLVPPGKGFSAFVDEALQARPELDVHLGPWARMMDRVPGRSAWRSGE